jgi:hypothetical protein
MCDFDEGGADEELREIARTTVAGLVLWLVCGVILWAVFG